MNLLIISQHFWPESFIINDIVFALVKKKNFTVTVITGKPNYHTGKIKKKYKSFFPLYYKKNNNLEIYRLPVFSRGNKSFFRLSLNYLSFIISGIIFSRKITKNKNYDLIFVYATSPIFQALIGIYIKIIKKIKLVLWVQDLWPGSVYDTGYIKNRKIISILNFFVKIIYKLSDKIIVQSPLFINYIRQQCKHSKIYLHYNPGRNIYLKKFNKIKKKFTILFTGNVGHAQSPETIIKTAMLFQKQDNFQFNIVGNGSKYEWLKNEISKNKIEKKIFLEKFKKQDKLIKNYKNSDVLLVILSKGEVLSKTIPAKFQSYLSLGKPIICCADGIVYHLVKKNNFGFAVKANDYKGLYKIIKKSSRLSTKMKNLIRVKNQSFYKMNFEINNNVEKLIKVLKK
jgi:glycosyltransferase involved in cell wall biosynthesis